MSIKNAFELTDFMISDLDLLKSETSHLNQKNKDERLQPTDRGEKVLENTKNIIWKNVYMNDGIVRAISQLCIRQEKILKGQIKPQD